MKTIQMKSMKIFASLAMMLFVSAGLMAGTNNYPPSNEEEETIAAEDAGCGGNWGLQIFYGTNYNGPARCLSIGTHRYQAGSLGYPKSIKVRRGYYATFKKNGRVLVSNARGHNNFKVRFDEVVIRRKPPMSNRQPLPGRGKRVKRSRTRGR